MAKAERTSLGLSAAAVRLHFLEPGGRARDIGRLRCREKSFRLSAVFRNRSLSAQIELAQIEFGLGIPRLDRRPKKACGDGAVCRV